MVALARQNAGEIPDTAADLQDRGAQHGLRAASLEEGKEHLPLVAAQDSVDVVEIRQGRLEVIKLALISVRAATVVALKRCPKLSQLEPSFSDVAEEFHEVGSGLERQRKFDQVR